MTSAEPADSRLTQFRARLRAAGARRALDVLIERAQVVGGWRCIPGSDDPSQEIRCVHETSGQELLTLSVAGEDLVISLYEAGMALVAGGRPALEAGLGAMGAGDRAGECAGDAQLWSLAISRPAQAETLVRLLFGGERTVRGGFRSRHWRLNVTRAGPAQIDGGYLWAAKQPALRAGQQARAGITRVLPGDVVFARANGRVIAIGIALERARSSPDPSLTSTDGWLVPVRFERLPDDAVPGPAQAPAPSPEPAAPEGRRRPPARAHAQLAQMPDDEAQTIRRAFWPRVDAFEEQVSWESGGTLVEQAIEDQIWLRTDITPTYKRQLSAARDGRGRFRDNVEQLEHGCRVTGILDRRYLHAVHIKPWRDATDTERLDGANGLLLSPHLGQLFGRGQISFADEGTLLISRHLNPFVQKAWIPQTSPLPQPFRAEQRIHLDYHRTRLFERVEGGRRRPASDPQEMP